MCVLPWIILYHSSFHENVLEIQIFRKILLFSHNVIFPWSFATLYYTTITLIQGFFVYLSSSFIFNPTLFYLPQSLYIIQHFIALNGGLLLQVRLNGCLRLTDRAMTIFGQAWHDLDVEIQMAATGIAFFPGYIAHSKLRFHLDGCPLLCIKQNEEAGKLLINRLNRDTLCILFVKTKIFKITL